MTRAPVATARPRSVVFDCGDPAGLAGFYRALLGGAVDRSDPDWCEVHVPGLPMKLAFQRVERFTAPDWPDGTPQQLHLDVTVDDLSAGSARAVALGARVLGEPVREPGSTFQVHADPAGHPFCLCRDDVTGPSVERERASGSRPTRRGAPTGDRPRPGGRRRRSWCCGSGARRRAIPGRPCGRIAPRRRA